MDAERREYRPITISKEVPEPLVARFCHECGNYVLDENASVASGGCLVLSEDAQTRVVVKGICHCAVLQGLAGTSTWRYFTPDGSEELVPGTA
jgi:hypothetical protein